MGGGPLLALKLGRELFTSPLKAGILPGLRFLFFDEILENSLAIVPQKDIQTNSFTWTEGPYK